MEVAFVNRMLGFRRGGGEIWDIEMANRMADLGVDITFVTGTPLRGAQPNPVSDFPCKYVKIPHLQELALSSPRGIGGILSDIDSQIFARKSATMLRSCDFDIVHINSRPEFAFFAANSDIPVTIKMNGPPHSFIYDTLHPFKTSYDLMRRFSAIVTTGITTQEVQQNIPNGKVTAINPGVDTELFSPGDESKKSTSGPDLLYVGRFVPSKNLRLLVDAFEKIYSNYPNASLRLVGDGPVFDKITQYVNRKDISNAVRFEGYVSNTDLPRYYRNSDIFVLSSSYENHPIVLLESMSCGTPVIAPNTGWIPKLISHSEDGLLYDTGSKSDLVSKLQHLIEDPEFRQELGECARQKAIDQFDWDQRANRLISLFQFLLSRQS